MNIRINYKPIEADQAIELGRLLLANRLAHKVRLDPDPGGLLGIDKVRRN
jgi:hypothetical protein